MTEQRGDRGRDESLLGFWHWLPRLGDHQSFSVWEKCVLRQIQRENNSQQQRVKCKGSHSSAHCWCYRQTQFCIWVKLDYVRKILNSRLVLEFIVFQCSCYLFNATFSQPSCLHHWRILLSLLIHAFSPFHECVTCANDKMLDLATCRIQCQTISHSDLGQLWCGTS